MENQKRDFIEWVRAHKKELAIAGISIATIVTAILCIRNTEKIKALWESLKKTINKVPDDTPSITTTSFSSFNEVAQETDILTDVAHKVQPPLRTTPQYAFDVTSHIRNLPKGQNASAEKIATAAEQGFILHQGQTWVEKYTKGDTAA